MHSNNAILKILIVFIFSVLIMSAHAQDSLTKSDILEKLRIFKKCKKDIRRVLAKDSVYWIVYCRDMPDYNYIEFYNLPQGEKRAGWIMYQYYFQKDNLIYIFQTKRNRKYFSRYYLNNGKIITADFSNEIPVLSQNHIDEFKADLIMMRERWLQKNI